MHLETLAPATSKLLNKIQKNSLFSVFYLAGGTALALQYGHRQSVDLDWFTADSINTKTLIKKLSAIGNFELLNEEANTVEGYLDKVKVSFMTYPYPLLNKKIKLFGKIHLASNLDIAVMKLAAISGRNTKKDFIDLYWYLQAEKSDLTRLFAKMRLKFSDAKYDIVHVCKSLVYFKEAETQPMPIMLAAVSWEKIKKYFISGTSKII